MCVANLNIKKNLDKVRTIHNQIIATTYWGNNNNNLDEIELSFANIFGITVGSGVQSCWFKHGSKIFAESIYKKLLCIKNIR